MESRINGSSKIITESRLKDLINDIEGDYAKSLVLQIYPLKIIKRFTFKPILGKYYPFIDVWTPYHDSQFALFYGKINLYLSNEKVCIICDNPLHKQEIKKTQLKQEMLIPVALCADCQQKVYFNYWGCLNKVIKNAFIGEFHRNHKINLNELTEINSTLNSNNKSSNRCDKTTCSNLLNPKCGFPSESESNNPCLKNHVIGLIIKDVRTMKLLIAPIEEIKYNTLYEGGLFGIVFGYSNRIMNLEIIEQKLGSIIVVVENKLKNLGEEFIISNPEEDITFLSPYSNKDLTKNKNINENENHAYFKWITLTFLIFYEKDDIFIHINDIFTTPIEILTEITKEIIEKTDLEILDFYELFKYYSPMRYNLRVYLEQEIEKELELKLQTTDVNRNLFSSSHSLSTPKQFSKILAEFARNSDSLEFFNTIKNIIKQSIEQYDFSQCQKELEIYEIYCSIGPILIVDSNVGNIPVVVNMKDLIGRKVY